MTAEERHDRRPRPTHAEVIKIIYENIVPEARPSHMIAIECREAGADYVTDDLVMQVRHLLGTCEVLLNQAERIAENGNGQHH